MGKDISDAHDIVTVDPVVTECCSAVLLLCAVGNGKSFRVNIWTETLCWLVNR